MSQNMTGANPNWRALAGKAKAGDISECALVELPTTFFKVGFNLFGLLCCVVHIWIFFGYWIVVLCSDVLWIYGMSLDCLWICRSVHSAQPVDRVSSA